MRVPQLAVLLSVWAASSPARAETGHLLVCHRGKLLDVASASWGGHQGHGDVLPTTSYADRDADGFGDALSSTLACALPPGFVTNATDCDDVEPATNPGAIESCNAIDDDCDAQVDEGQIGETWHLDRDIDGFGDPASSLQRCAAPAGTTADATDCDDRDAAVNPNASETCSPADDDCDGVVNEGDAIDAATWYEDADLDGIGGDAFAVSACEAPAGWVASSDDCADGDPTSFPGALEVCDGADNDCDGPADEDAVDAFTWYLDADGDDYGDGAVPAVDCLPPAGHVADASDCDDDDASVSPAGLEVCDGVDDDCDGVSDEPDAADALTFYADVDADGYGVEAAWAIACALPLGGCGSGPDQAGTGVCRVARPVLAGSMVTWWR